MSYGIGWGGVWGGVLSTVLPPAPPSVLDALAVRENVIRLRFAQPISWTLIGDIRDGSIVDNYSITSVAGTFGMDGLPAKAARVVMVERTPLAIAGAEYGSLIDVYLDRPMSPYPAAYVVSYSMLFFVGAATPIAGDVQVVAVFRQLQSPLPDAALVAADFANPQTMNAFPNGSGTVEALGTFNYDDTGDYANDEGTVSLYKRVVRRLITRKDSFAHLPGYGVGVPAEAKRLNNESVRGRLADEAQRQLSKEPEVKKCSCRFVVDTERPNLARLRILIQTKQGQSVKFDVPFAIT